jgi:hypothetical protein
VAQASWTLAWLQSRLGAHWAESLHQEMQPQGALARPQREREALPRALLLLLLQMPLLQMPLLHLRAP